jgi:hypothetical protein
MNYDNRDVSLPAGTNYIGTVSLTRTAIYDTVPTALVVQTPALDKTIAGVGLGLTLIGVMLGLAIYGGAHTIADAIKKNGRKS